MSYANLQDLLDRAGTAEIGQIADRNRDGVPDDEVIEAALTHADNMVNGYVGAKYALPLASTPPILRTWSVSIARYFLHRDGAPDYVAADYKDAIGGLKDVSRGLITLPDASGSEPAPSSGSFLAEIHDPHFSMLRGWLC
jgi:phage gp36-like protein